MANSAITARWERRYEIAPQMRDYDDLDEKRWLPYLMFFQHPGRRAASFTTDNLGFRTSVRAGQSLNFEEFCRLNGPRAALVGGSTAFGVGATSDAQTLTSRLNGMGDRVWFNFAGRAFNSTQEWILFLLHLPPDVETVVLFTGINNLALSHVAGSTSPIYNSFYNQSVFEQALARGLPGGVQGAARDLFRELTRKARRLSSPAPSANGTGRSVTDERIQAILACFRRDLQVWSLLRKALGFRLLFAFQPVASWIQKEFSPEEKEMFTLLDEIQGPHWDILSGYLTEWAPTYRDEVRRICGSLEVPFVDLNEAASLRQPQWLFVDRAHLTDAGYALCADEIRRGFSL